MVTMSERVRDALADPNDGLISLSDSRLNLIGDLGVRWLVWFDVSLGLRWILRNHRWIGICCFVLGHRGGNDPKVEYISQ
jgi:hypothetical protein